MTINNLLSFGLAKGGTGKTSTVCNVGGLMAHGAQRRTLIIDLDPQANTRYDLGVDEDPTDGKAMTNALLYGEPLPIIEGVRPRLDLALGGTELGRLSLDAMRRQDLGAKSLTQTLEQSIAAIASNYDLVIVDTPPGESLLGTAALAASRGLVIPTKTDPASIGGLRQMANRVVQAREHNPNLITLGILLFAVGSNASRIKLHAKKEINRLVGTAIPVFDHSIRHTEAAAWDTRNRGVLAYELVESANEADKSKFAALRSGETDTIDLRSTGSTAGALAADYASVLKEILGTMAVAPPMSSLPATARS